MASSNMSQQLDDSRWYSLQGNEDAKMYLETVLKIIGYTSAYLVSVLITINIIIVVCLIGRMLRVTLGRRTEPDGKKAILITGATSGIGLVIAKYFFGLGFTVIGAYYNDQEPGYAELLELGIKSSSAAAAAASSTSATSLLTPEHPGQVTIHVSPAKSGTTNNNGSSATGNGNCKKRGARMFLVRMDVRSRESIEKSSKEIEAILDQYDIELYALINNAGISREGLFQWSGREAIRDVIETNLTGVMMVSRQFLYRIIKSKGRVVNVASGLYPFPSQGNSVYGCSKSAIAHFSDALDADLSGYGASSRCVVPGNFTTTSNILFPKIKSIQDCISKLTPEERELYRVDIDTYTRVLDELIRKRFLLGDHLDPVQVSTVYRVRLPDDVMSGQVKRSSSSSTGAGCFERAISWLLQKLDGGANAESLEKSGLLQGYDYAVRLRSCPRRLYPGHRFYSHFSGPILDYTPRVLLDLIARLIMISMMNQ